MIISTRIHGIPCQVRVTHYCAADPRRTWGPPEQCWPAEPAEVEFEVLDSRGRTARWLERKMDDADTQAVEQEIIAAMEEQAKADQDQAAEDAAEDRYFWEHFA